MDLFKREKYLKKIRPFYDQEDLIKVITGVRRCGKSSLMQTICEELKSTGIKDEQIIYIDLDSRKNRNINKANDLDNLIETLSTVDNHKYLFIDEIQNVDNFEEVVNGYRTDGGYSIFITGSNSYLLSGELATKLTGRYVEFELYTLSFDEYEDIKRFYNKPINPNPLVELNNYILEGGFPRTIQFDDLQTKRTYTESVVKEIFEKDIRRRMKSKKSLSGEKKYYVSDLSFYFSLNTDNQINYGPVLENIIYFYAKSHDYSISVGRIGKLECDFILRDHNMNYSYVQVAYTIALSKQTEDREYKSLESIKDNYPKYVMTTDYLLQKRNGIKHVNLIEFMTTNSEF